VNTMEECAKEVGLERKRYLLKRHEVCGYSSREYEYDSWVNADIDCRSEDFTYLRILNT
jgi:hypothetical protein